MNVKPLRILTLLLFLYSNPLWAQETEMSGLIKGIIFDLETQEVLPGVGVTVTFEGRSTRTATGSDGQFELRGLASGKYNVSFSFIGYAKKTIENVSVKEGQMIDLGQLFTKDRSKPFLGLTNLYELPANAGTQVAKKIASFNTNTKKSEGATTSADISPDGKMVALLSHDIIWLFTDFMAPQYFAGASHQLYITKNHQFEGIVFEDNCRILLTNERSENGEVQLMAYNICR